MATLAQWDGGALPAVTNGNVTLDAATGYPAAPSIAIEQTSGNQAYAEWTFGAVTQAAARFWMRTPSAWGSTAAIIATLGSAAVSESRIYLAGTGAPGQVRLYRSGTQIGASANGTVELDTWYRFELQIDAAAGQARAGVFPASGTTPLWDSGWTADASLSTTATRLQLGRIGINPTMNPLRLDSVLAVDDVATWVGEDAPDPEPTASAVFVKDGPAAVTGAVFVKNGAAATPTTAAWVKDGAAVTPI